MREIIADALKKEKGQDRNPARFKIQYPMKNHRHIYKPHAK